MLEFDFRIYQQFYASLAFSWCNLQGISWGREKTKVCICNLPKILLIYMHGNMLWLHRLNPYPFFFDCMGPLEFNILIFLEKIILLGKKNGTWKRVEDEAYHWYYEFRLVEDEAYQCYSEFIHVHSNDKT